ncbi:MAG: hypothetical protein JKX97_05160 [Candidatus Lindowbacteria bacterium]|nr:hypothetical protein [Candidatus Lindowbacteria bacterium]
MASAPTNIGIPSQSTIDAVQVEQLKRGSIKQNISGEDKGPTQTTPTITELALIKTFNIGVQLNVVV